MIIGEETEDQRAEVSSPRSCTWERQSSNPQISCLCCALPAGPPSATLGDTLEFLEPTPSYSALWNSRTEGHPSPPRFRRIPSRSLSPLIITAFDIGELPPLPHRRNCKIQSTPKIPARSALPFPFSKGEKTQQKFWQCPSTLPNMERGGEGPGPDFGFSETSRVDLLAATGSRVCLDRQCTGTVGPEASPVVLRAWRGSF